MLQVVLQVETRMKFTSSARICTGLYLICSVATTAILVRSGSRSQQVVLHPLLSSLTQDSTRFPQSLDTFNRPPGTVALQPSLYTGSFENTYGRTFGQYGSYRDHNSWQQAVRDDNLRHSLIRNNLKDTFPWLFKNMKTPSLRGFGLDGFWNSYTPYVPEGVAAVAETGSQVGRNKNNTSHRHEYVFYVNSLK